MAGGGCGGSPGGRRSMTGKEVRSRYDKEVLQLRTATDWGGVRIEEGIKIYTEKVETGGTGGGRIKLLAISNGD